MRLRRIRYRKAYMMILHTPIVGGEENTPRIFHPLDAFGAEMYMGPNLLTQLDPSGRFRILHLYLNGR